MGKLRVLSGADVVGILERHGFQRLRQKGSHLSLQGRDVGGSRTVVVPMHRELRAGTLSSIVRQSGLSRELFEAEDGR